MTTYDTSLDPISPDFDPCSWGPQAGAQLALSLNPTETQRQRVRDALAEGQARYGEWQSQIDDHAAQADARHVRDVTANGDAVVVTLSGVPASWTMQRVERAAVYGARRSGHSVTTEGIRWASAGNGHIDVFVPVSA